MKRPKAKRPGGIGANLRAERARVGWSRATLAEAAEVSISCIVEIEAGRTSPRISTVQTLAAKLGVSVARLIEGAT